MILEKRFAVMIAGRFLLFLIFVITVEIERFCRLLIFIVRTGKEIDETLDQLFVSRIYIWGI